MTIIVAPSITGYLCPGMIWLPNQWNAMMNGQIIDFSDSGITVDSAGDYVSAEA